MRLFRGSPTRFSDVEGILGLGPADLTLGTLEPGILETIPTVTQTCVLSWP